MNRGDLPIKLYDFKKSPDGHDCLEKTYYYTKYAAISGAVFSFYETVLFSKPATAHGVIGRFGRFTFPFAGMGFVFGSSLCLLGKIRQKDDIANHLIAGAAAGSIWGFKFNSIKTGHTLAVFCGFIAAYLKFFEVYNIPMWNMRPECEDQDRPILDFGIKMYDDPGRPNEA